jgi:CubicO group peptidase (beta-lactamase class C family)
MYTFLSTYNLKRDIGAKAEYSNYAVALLGQILARRAGTDYATLARTRITQPLGMADTVLRPTPEMQTRVAHGHDESLKPAPNWDLSGAFAAAGGLHSTATDLLKFAAANLGLRSSPVLAAMQRSHQPNETAKMQMGLGWGIHKPCGASDMRYHNGGTGGYASYLGVDLQRHRGVVVLSNTTNDIDAIGHRLLESRLPLPEDPTAIKLNGKALYGYVGEYRLQPNAVLTLTRRGDRLVGQRTGGDKMEIFAETETEFFLKAAELRFSFVKDSAGRVTQVILHHPCGVDERGLKVK